MNPPTIIVLNGVGSVGKTSLARAIQNTAREPFTYIAMDTFIEMLPEWQFGHQHALRWAAEDIGMDWV